MTGGTTIGRGRGKRTGETKTERVVLLSFFPRGDTDSYLRSFMCNLKEKNFFFFKNGTQSYENWFYINTFQTKKDPLRDRFFSMYLRLSSCTSE